jgi:pimeloyl-ACP methyl ester carboxylesterase
MRAWRVGAGALAMLTASPVSPHRARTTTAPVGHYATVAGYGMYYEEYGRGRPVVLLHGGLNTIAGSFARQIPVLARAHHVIAVEQVGHGHTADARETFTYAQMADDTAALLRQLNVAPADLVGWSDGGIIALVIARRYPDLVRRLVVSGVSVDVEGQRPEDVQALRDESSAAGTTVADKVRQLWLTPVVLAREDLARIEAPVLVVSGDRDIIRLEHTVEIYESLPNAELCILPGTGHDTFQSAADSLNPLILRFLGGA